MNLRFYIEPETDYPHMYRHGVAEYEVEDVLLDPGEDRPSRGNARVAIGQTRSGRYLRVVYVPDYDDPDSAFIVTAYELRGNQRTAYRRRRKRRGK